jgi:hypothetical protein
MDVEGRFIVQYTRRCWVSVYRVHQGLKSRYEMHIETGAGISPHRLPWRGWRIVRTLDEVNALLADMVETLKHL